MSKNADLVAERYQVSREQQDEFACESQRRTAIAMEAGRFGAEIVPLPTLKSVVDARTGETLQLDVCLTADEGNRPQTTMTALAALKPVRGEAATITAGTLASSRMVPRPASSWKPGWRKSAALKF